MLAAILGRGHYRPRVVIVETNFHLEEGHDWVVKYSPFSTWVGNAYSSASRWLGYYH